MLLIVFGFMLRLYLAASLPLWGDESMTLWGSGESVSRIITAAVDQTHPPGSYLVLKLWRSVSDHLLWSRMLSICLSVANGYLIWKLTKRYFSTHITPIVATALYAVSGYFLIFDWQVRIYTGLSTLILMSLYTYLGLTSHFSKRSIIYFTVINIIGLYYDYGFLWYFIPLGCCTLWNFWFHRSRVSVYALLSVLTSAAIFAVLHPTLFLTYHKGFAGIDWIRQYLSPAFILPFFLGSHDSTLMLLGTILLVLLGTRSYRPATESERISIRFVYFVLMCSLITLDYSYIANPIFHVRSFQILGLIVLFAYASGLSSILKAKRYAVAAVVLVVFSVHAAGIVRDIRVHPGIYLINYYPWKSVKQSLDAQRISRVYIRADKGKVPRLLLWGLTYSLDGKESLFQKPIPYILLSPDANPEITDNCRKFTGETVELFICPSDTVQ